MQFLRTNTATRITVGPFLDKTDGVTPEVALTVTSEKLTFIVDTGGVPTLVLDTAPTASAGANDMVHIIGDDAGYYDLELAAADVNYLGRAKLALTDATVHCPVFHEFMILPANVYDSLVLGTDALDVSAIQFAGQTITCSGGVTVPAATLASTTNITAATGVVLSGVTHTGAIIPTVSTLTGHTPQTGDSFALANGANGFVAIKGDTAAILTDTGTTLDTKLNNIQGATFDTATDSLEALRNRGDAAWITATGFSTHSAADVWAAATRTLTAGTNIALAKGTGVTGFNDVSSADVTTACTSSLNTYDPPTKAETDALLTTAMTESYAVDGATITPAQALYMIWACVSEFAISGTTITAKKLDGSTTAMTFTLSDATNPTSRTRAT